MIVQRGRRHLRMGNALDRARWRCDCNVLGFVARSLGVPGEIAANDRAVRERDEDLQAWLTDEHVRLKRELEQIRRKLAADGLFHSGEYGLFRSGEYGYRLNLAKEAAIHEYRDQKRRARRDVALIHGRETWVHGVWRQITLQPRAELQIRVGDAADEASI
jgi:hypothetical protein